MTTVDLRQDFVFAGHLDDVSAAREAIMDFLRQHCSLGSDEFDILVAVQEALANAVLHGCGNDPSKSIHCSVSLNPTEIQVVVRDPGEGFDAEQAVRQSGLETNRSESGRGISLMSALMTEVSYGCNGSEVRLKKTLRALEAWGEPLLKQEQQLDQSATQPLG